MVAKKKLLVLVLGIFILISLGRCVDALPDLVPTSVSAPTSAKIGDSITISWSVKNQGTSASGSFYNRISLSTSPYGTSPYSLGYFQMNSISAGSSLPDSGSVAVPSNVALGCYYVTVWADAYQSITESNENNNIEKAPNQICITSSQSLPSAPILIFPTNWASISTTTPTLDWNDIIANPAVDYYNVQIRQGTTKIHDAWPTSSQYTVPSGLLSNGITYNWYVYAHNSLGFGPVSSIWYFTVTQSCTCTSWVNGACGGGGCPSTQRQQTRTCTPSACQAESQCISDATCQLCTPNSKRCNGNIVETCKSDGSGWTTENCGKTKYCSSGSCVSCSSGTGNCNENAGDGCEINLLTNNNNCGSCGNVCSSGSCQDGVCKNIATAPYSINFDLRNMVGFNDGIISADKIRVFIQNKNPNSPMLSETNIGEEFINYGLNNNVNPAFLVATAKLEGQFGTAGWALSHPECHNTMGWGIPSGSTPPDSINCADSWGEIIRRVAYYIAHGSYYYNAGKYSVDEVRKVYAAVPNSQSIADIMNDLYIFSGGSITDSLPVVNAFNVTPRSLVLGNSFTITYTVSDDIGLSKVALWRADDSNGQAVNWNEIKSTSISGKSYSGSFTDAPSPAGTYWYGVHVNDNSGNPEHWNDERNSRTGFLPGVYGPIKVNVCVNECSLGQTRCNGNYKQICQNYDTDACYEWPVSTSGSGNELCQNSCQNGQCITTGCSSGVCCDTLTGQFRPSTYKCQENIATEYGCPWGTGCGVDVGVRRQSRYCSGSSPNCDGTLQWDSWVTAADCSSTEICIDKNPVCSFNPSCSSTSDWKSPTANGAVYREFTNPSNAYTQDQVYASYNCDGFTTHYHDYYNFNFNVPEGNVITRIDVMVIELKNNALALFQNMQISRDRGANFIYSGASSFYFEGNNKISTDTFNNYGSGLNWLASDVSNYNFRAKVFLFCRGSTDVCYLDAIQAKVYYAAAQCTAGVCCDTSQYRFKPERTSCGTNNVCDNSGTCWPLADANRDGLVNILDLIFIRDKLNSDVSISDNWKADTNQDGKINLLDLIFVRNNFGKQG